MDHGTLVRAKALHCEVQTLSSKLLSSEQRGHQGHAIGRLVGQVGGLLDSLNGALLILPEEGLPQFLHLLIGALIFRNHMNQQFVVRAPA